MSIVGDLSLRIAELGKVAQPPLGKGERICSNNTKTGFSVNFPLGPKGTCRPTRVCGSHCYGAMPGKPITWVKPILKYWRVYRYFMETPAEEIAERIHREYVAHKMTFLRWNGVGDLFPKSVAVLSVLVDRYPEMVILVVTRKPEMVPRVPVGPNLYLMFSLDGSKSSIRRKAEALKHEHPRLFFSFLRRKANEDTMGARIVFNAQQAKKKGTLSNDDPVTVCPVDADEVSVKGACPKCRKCFNPKTTLNGRQHPGPKGA